MTATQMAKAMGYPNYGSANMHYGKLGKLIGNELGWNTSTGVFTIAEFEKKPKKDWIWIMRPEVAQAIERLGWVTRERIQSVEVGVPQKKMYIFAWNPLKDPWDNHKDDIDQVGNGKLLVRDWSCGNTKKIEKGDAFVLIRLGKEPKGVIGCGTIVSKPHDGEHWDVKKAAKGKRGRFAKLRFHVLSEKPIIFLSDMQSAYPDTNWTPQSGGVSVPEWIAIELSHKIADFKNSGFLPVNERVIDEAVAELETITSRTDLGETEKATLIQARRGQGKFRENLQAIEKKCRITGVGELQYLEASHIKSWKDSDDGEKLNGNNGLLLSPHIHFLFDKLLISFDDTGEMLISNKLDLDVLASWGIPKNKNVGKFNPEQMMFLKHHREIFFKKQAL